MPLRTLTPWILLTVLLVLNWLSQPVEHSRLHSPDGRYTAVLSAPRLWLPGMQEQGDDRRGQVSIIDSDGRELGTIEVESLSQANRIRWLKNGASIYLAGAWNFDEGFYAYWNSDRTELITGSVD